MGKQAWNEEKVEHLMKQLPKVKDKQNPEEIYQNISNELHYRRKQKKWFAPAIASIAAICIMVIMSPFLLSNFNIAEQKSSSIMDSGNAELNNNSELAIEEKSESMETKSKDIDSEPNKKYAVTEQSNEQVEEEQKTFVLAESDANNTITIGFTDEQAQVILPITIMLEENPENIEVLEEIVPEVYYDELGPVTYELQGIDIEQPNQEEIRIELNQEQQMNGSRSEELFKNAIIETFRWHDYKHAYLYTNDEKGIELPHSGVLDNLEVPHERKKAYFLYQYNQNTLKLLVPSPNPYDSINMALEDMKNNQDNYNLKSTILDNINIETITEQNNMLEITFHADSKFLNNQEYIIMLESILLVAKEFGFERVLFKGIGIDKIGNMDVTKPIAVPYSPNPIDAN